MSCASGLKACFGFDDTKVVSSSKKGWSTSPVAEKKVQLDVVWEVPPEAEEAHVAGPDFAVAKYSKIKPLNAALLDSYIDGYQRTTTLFFGRIVSNPDDLPAFAEPLGYNMTYNAMATGNGNALHRHNSVEIFVALDAPMEIAYGSHGEFKALLQPWDLVACPAEVIHSYKNMGQDGGQILTFLCGKPAITWAPGVVEHARKNGAECDDTGILLAHSPLRKKVRPTTAKPGVQEMSKSTSLASFDTAATDDTVATESDLKETRAKLEALQGIDADELIVGAGALDKFVYRYRERETRSLKVSSSVGAMRIHWKDLAPDCEYSPEGNDDTLVVVLRGAIKSHGRTYTHLDVLKQPKLVIGGEEGATLLVTRSSLPHNLNFFFDADITA